MAWLGKCFRILAIDEWQHNDALSILIGRHQVGVAIQVNQAYDKLADPIVVCMLYSSLTCAIE